MFTNIWPSLVNHKAVNVPNISARFFLTHLDSMLVLSIANFAIGPTNFSLANFLKTFHQFGETLLMVLTASIRRHYMSYTSAVVFHNSYATGSDKLRITKMTTRLPVSAAIFVKAPTWKASLSRWMTMAML